MNKPVVLVTTIAIIGAGVVSASAAQPSYRDDRSTPAAVVASYYNAVNRHEYARAYSYFNPTNPPEPYARFKRGYGETVSVRVVTGDATAEGAAGSTYFTLPVAIDALSRDGTHHQFAGCYTVRLIEPTIQEPPVIPMFIAKAHLKAMHGAIRGLLPTCKRQ